MYVPPVLKQEKVLQSMRLKFLNASDVLLSRLKHFKYNCNKLNLFQIKFKKKILTVCKFEKQI